MSGGVEATCRKCRKTLRGFTYLQIGVSLGGGANKVCVDCVDKYMSRGNFKTVRDWVTVYIKECKPDTVQSLRAEIEQLRELLDSFTNPEQGSDDDA